MAMEVLIAVVASAPVLRAMTMRIAEATEARAASGATAAPTFAQPSAIIWSEPPSMMPSVGWPVTMPMSVHATSG